MSQQFALDAPEVNILYTWCQENVLDDLRFGTDVGLTICKADLL